MRIQGVAGETVRASRIRIESGYLAAADAQLVPRLEGAFSQEMLAARKHAPEETLWALNERLIRLAEGLRFAVWISLFPGIFRVEVRLAAVPPAEPEPPLQRDRFLGNEQTAVRLCVPSGELCLFDLAAPMGEPRCLAPVPAGEYLAWLAGDTGQQARHEFLETEAAYPEGDGPDWVLLLTASP